jgi:hypothetical protein
VGKTEEKRARVSPGRRCECNIINASERTKMGRCGMDSAGSGYGQMVADVNTVMRF